MKVSDVIANIKNGIDKAETEKKEIIHGLGADAPESIESIRDALGIIQTQFQAENIPYATIEVGLNHVMKILLKHEDLAVELEPQDISQIVQSYIALTDEETRTIFDKAAKKKKAAPKESVEFKRALKAAKEDISNTDVDDLVF